MVAPNSFKGSLSAAQAAAAIARGVREVIPGADVIEIPVADGGDGTVDALVAARGGEYRLVTVEGPLGEPVKARFGLIDDARIAVVELATASGLALIDPSRLEPLRASTYGFGQLLHASQFAETETIIAGIGGSATNDGGAGMAQALGCSLLNIRGHQVPRGGAALLDLDRIVWVEPHGVDVIVACDVTNPLTGPLGASRVYGPQKGADEQAVELLDRALGHFADVIERDLGKNVRDLPGSGAAGGTGAGLVAFLGARLVPGAALIVDAAGFDSALTGADLVITGEGRIDSQTAFGKAPGEVAKRAQKAGVPVLFLAGTRGSGWDELRGLGTTAVYTLDDEKAQDGGPDRQNLAQLMQNADQALTATAARAIRERRW